MIATRTSIAPDGIILDGQGRARILSFPPEAFLSDQDLSSVKGDEQPNPFSFDDNVGPAWLWIGLGIWFIGVVGIYFWIVSQ